MYKIILDTNIFLSAFVFSGLLPQKIIDLVIEKKMKLFTSADLEEEIFRKLSKLKANEEALTNVDLLLKSALSYKPEITISVCRDPKDNFILELAQTSKADYIITRDKDLLELPDKKWRNTKITKPEAFLSYLRSKRLLK
jgi:putative PIN family toxin of toxin-antitoxin system